MDALLDFLKKTIKLHKIIKSRQNLEVHPQNFL